MKTNIKKSIKFVTLLLSALLIGTASAAIYNYMQITATVGVKGFDVNFYEGEDTSKAGGTISNDRQTVTFTNMKGLSGQPVTYSDSVRICNNGTTGHNIKLEIESHQYSEYADDNLDYIKITIYDSGGTSVDSLQLDPHGDDGGDDLTTEFHTLNGNNDWWRVQWDILWFGNATTSDYVNITLKITVES
jgi:hypothetical protein